MTELNAITHLLLNPPRWVLMWLLAGALFLAGKMAIAWPLRKRLGWRGVLCFGLLWVGMDARAFIGMNRERTLPRRFAFLDGIARLMLGAVLLWVAARHLGHPLAQGWCGMLGLILMLHFGAFGVLADLWNACGVRVAPIMNHPTHAVSVAEFWGRRWNSAFRDLAHPLVFRPVARLWGMHAALWISFAVSGLAHELVISVPAGAGFGLPTGYFLLQALGIALERRVFKNMPVNAGRVKRWFFTHAFTALPAFFLFHPPFVERVMVPFFHAIGALP